MAYDYGCLMLDFNIKPTVWRGISRKLINPADIYEKDGGYGIEDQAHVTLLYGLHHDKFNILDIVPMLRDIGQYVVSTSRISSFKNDEFDVLKFDVDGNALHNINKYLTQNFEFTTDFPDYHPHATLAYLKPGTSDKYVTKLSKPYVLPALQYNYSAPDGTNTLFNV